MTRWLLALLLAALVSPAAAQEATANFAHLYDVDSASLTYCLMTGQNGDPFAAARNGTAAIKTTGSSTTVVEYTTGTNPFADLAPGDTIIVNADASAPPVSQTVMITAKASAASITVSTALTLTTTGGHQFRWLKQTCGTAITNGWANVTGHRTVSLTVQYEQGDLDGLRVRWECKAAGVGAAPVIVYPGESSDCGLGGTLSTDRCDFATAGVTARLTVLVEGNPFTHCRVGLAYAATDTSDAAANLEQVTATVTKVK